MLPRIYRDLAFLRLPANTQEASLGGLHAFVTRRYQIPPSLVPSRILLNMRFSSLRPTNFFAPEASVRCSPIAVD